MTLNLLYCHNCQTRNDDDESSCQKCGSNLSTPSHFELDDKYKKLDKYTYTAAPSKSPDSQWASYNKTFLGFIVLLVSWIVFSLLTSNFFLGAIIALLPFIFWRLKVGLESRNWPTINGKIIASSVLRTGESSQMYSASIQFSYTVEVINYGSETIKFNLFSGLFIGKSGGTFRKKSQQIIVEKYPIGKEVIVFYNPDDPTIAVLQPGPQKSLYILFLIFLLLAIFVFLSIF